MRPELPDAGEFFITVHLADAEPIAEGCRLVVRVLARQRADMRGIVASSDPVTSESSQTGRILGFVIREPPWLSHN